jgi:hypothetical protein
LEEAWDAEGGGEECYAEGRGGADEEVLEIGLAGVFGDDVVDLMHDSRTGVDSRSDIRRVISLKDRTATVATCSPPSHPCLHTAARYWVDRGC